jgi:glycosyltransferase involved in cell wall biosynthesis
VSSDQKLHIVHIIPNLKKGGAERMVIELLRGLLAIPGNKLKLILFENKIDYEVDDLRPIIEVIPASVHLSFLKRNKLNIDELQQCLEKFQPDIIHTHLFETEIVTRSCLYPKATWFSHAHDRMKSFQQLALNTLQDKRTWTNLFEKKYLFRRYKKNGGNHFIAISKDIEQYLHQVLPEKNQQVFLLQNAIDVQRFSKPEGFISSGNQSTCTLISIGRLDENKNHSFLIKVVVELKTMGIPVHLQIIGEGEQRQVLEKEIHESQLTEEISLLGQQDHVEHYLWSSNIYVHSAYSEGFGLTLLEAMASGLPVVSLDGGGNKDLLIEGKNGYLIHDRDPVKFAHRIAYLWSNKNTMLDMGKFALEFVKPFSMKFYCQHLIKLYKNSLECAE